MSFTLYFHPFSSYCQKVLIALYENGTPFEPRLIDLADAASRAELTRLWPIGKFPVLRDQARDRTVPEASIIIEYLSRHYPGRTELVPADPDLARDMRLRDRFYDLYVNDPMGRIVADRLRPPDRSDAFGVEQAKTRLATAYDLIETEMRDRQWAMGGQFTMADCAAAPALFYANLVLPLGDARPKTAAYLARLMARPSFARAIAEAQPYVTDFPMADAYRTTYRHVTGAPVSRPRDS